MSFGRKPGYVGGTKSGMYGKSSTRSGSGTLAVANTTFVAITDTLMATANTDQLNPSVTWDSANDRWAVTETGLYRLSAEVDWASGPAAGRHFGVVAFTGGVSIFNVISPIAVFEGESALSVILDVTLVLAATATAQLQVFQSSGGSINVSYADYTITRCD